MSLNDSTHEEPRGSSPFDPLKITRERFLDKLRAGLAPRIEDHLIEVDPALRPSLLRELIIIERDWKESNGLRVNPQDYLGRFPGEGRLIDELLGHDRPGSTVSQRDRSETEGSLLFGFLCLANGLITAEVLTNALDNWAVESGRTLREILVDRGDLSDPDALMIDILASKHLDQHHGRAWESLVALGKSVRFRIDPGEVADSELRLILAGFVEAPRPLRGPGGGEGVDSRYEIIRRHAKGGLGVVNLARDREIHREVALKEIREDCADHPDYRARFLREAEVTGRLEHPGIVPVYGVGHHPDGRPYYIMRFIRGETLKVAIGRLHKPEEFPEMVGATDRSTLHSLLGRFVDACHAVAYAHHRKILHRDIKPINIMLGPFGESLVVDWGLAKSFDGSRSDEYPMAIEEGTLRPESGSGMTPTMIGSQVGTTGYMSPEQADGRLTELGPTSDIYSLGATLHYLVTGHAPFEGAGKEDFLRRVREGEFARPSKVKPDVPRALEAICLKAMALRPIDRFQSVGELIEELERWRAGSPVRAYPEPPIDRLARWSKKHRTALAGAAVLLCCATIGLAIFAGREREENRKLSDARAVADRQRVASEFRRKFALGLLKSTLREVSGADLTFLTRSEGFRARMADELVESYRKLAVDDPADRQIKFDLAQACQLSANIGRSMGKPDRPRELYAEAIRLLESLEGWSPEGEDTRLELATVRNDAGENFRMIGQPDEARSEFLKGLETLRQPVDPARPPILQQRAEARLQLDLSSALAVLGRLDRAEEASRRAIDLLRPLASEPTAERIDRLLLVYALLGRADSLKLLGKGGEAAAELADAARRARELMIASPDPDTRYALAAVRNSQGFLMIEAGPDGPGDAASKAFQEALYYLVPLYKDMPRVIHFQRIVASTLIGRGICHRGLKKFEEARVDFSSAAQLLDRLDAVIPGHFYHLGLRGLIHANLSRTSRAEGKPDVGDLPKAIHCHSLALKANPDSPEDRKLLAECRQELIRLEAEATPPPGRP